ncbi:carbon starvation CstA family protein [Clostridium chauvoei]|uniref:Putative Carbon starvation protein CstA n=1 Tax=Clostridium chauvoei JF4335 TaxID=1351755 RepID=A0A1U6J3Y2_9CLOT|nr:carbon starvation protein A [Clostridium chauvoei]ATD54560.1 carbon starvation protein A [Clostridium chauvoei]ATD57759.1 carbon starvation protein A [Clostridium chauvoei]MBX7281540.1 carbon starvation protein A [Clostridium chauvoei]MBX7284060.1 carbon starvation protein A [Clostridium chauvoei]MBX7286588.1 carbon starvation protein A [Clostridium chauvoei]
MISFLISLVLLVVGYFTYGKFVEKTFGTNDLNKAPSETMQDGVDFVPMSWPRIFLIQFLNIAGLGPIFGAIAGALWGPAAFLWIVFGCIFAGAVHDFFTGVLSMRNKGASVADLVGKYLGDIPRKVMVVFSVVLLVLVGVVFLTGPADLLKTLTGIDRNIFIVIIIIYYIAATVLPVDKIIGKIYPLFGACLLIMAVGIGAGILIEGYTIPEIQFINFHPKGTPIFPYLFITIACGAISGFHATQSPIMARCVRKESEARKVFYGAMIAEGVIALIWAAAAMSFFGGTPGLSEALANGGPSTIVNTISNTLMGKVGAVLAVLGVVACPITSGDTAFRSARLTIADTIGMKQDKFANRFKIAIPLFIVGIALTFIDFAIIWRYFSWANQTLAMIMLWAASAYMVQAKKNYWICTIPAVFMSAVTSAYILQAPEGFRLAAGISNTIGILFALVLFVIFIRYTRKKAQENISE